MESFPQLNMFNKHIEPTFLDILKLGSISMILSKQINIGHLHLQIIIILDKVGLKVCFYSSLMSILNRLSNSDIDIVSITKQFEFVLVDSVEIASSSKLILCFIQDLNLPSVS